MCGLKRSFVKRTIFALVLGFQIGVSAALAQNAPKKPAAPPKQPIPNLADELARRLSQELHAKTVVGEPIKAGTVTLIPILMVEVNFAGGSGPAPAKASPGVDGFLMSGDARPLGFVAITKNGTRFISAAGAPPK